ncbi:MAG: ABC transporter ATP-binding protein [Actinomycetota bacterium]|nr:ABC transporter ATP-binding protein [Actinomycetota bacterium]
MNAPGGPGDPKPAEQDFGDGLAIEGSITRGGFELRVDLTVARAQILGVLGPNGAGKTTLLRTLAGLHAMTDGQIRLNGTVFDDATRGVLVSPERRPVGFVFQNYRLFGHLNVRDNVAFGPRCRGTSRGEARRVADSWLARIGIGELAGRKPGGLSGGEAQRVALARALAAEPALLLLDEPLAALDARTKIEVRGELRQHLRGFGGATVLVTHDPLEAMVMADQLVVIEGGRIVQRGTPAEVARRPATEYVARLVGLNLYRGVAHPGGAIALDGGGTLLASAAATGSRVLVAIRPSALALHTVRPEHSSPRNVWQGRVAGMELLTDRVRTQIEGEPPALVDLTADAVADLGLSEGNSIWVSAKATDLDVYPDLTSPWSGC